MCLFEHWIGLALQVTLIHKHSHIISFFCFCFFYFPYFVPTSTWHISCMVIFWFFDTFAALLPDLFQNIINLWMLQVYWDFTFIFGFFFSLSLFFRQTFQWIVHRFALFFGYQSNLFIFIFGSTSIFSVCIWHFLTIIRLFRS